MKIQKKEHLGTSFGKTIYKSLWVNHISLLPRLSEILTVLIGGMKSNIMIEEKNLLGVWMQKVEEIQRFPEQFQIIYKNRVRRALVLRFPYSVFYVEKPEVLSIFAIQRQNRNPALWKSLI
jgi:hypothetical protein